MLRRSFLSLIGLAPVAAASASSAGQTVKVSAPFAPTSTTFAGMGTMEALRAAVNLGVLKESDVIDAIRSSDDSVLDQDADLRAYKSFSEVARQRIRRERNEARLLRSFREGPPTSLWGLARKLPGVD